MVMVHHPIPQACGLAYTARLGDVRILSRCGALMQFESVYTPLNLVQPVAACTWPHVCYTWDQRKRSLDKKGRLFVSPRTGVPLAVEPLGG